MSGRHKPHRAWRRLVSCFAAYALVLHAILLGVAAGAAAHGADPNGGFELCVHSTDGTALIDPAGGVPNSPSNHDHCQFCVAGAPPFIAPALISFSCAIAFVRCIGTPEISRDLPASPELSCEQPRGPPVV